ncbi:MAG: DNA mismatch repair protein MutS [Fimbriimonadaceae bacterium]|nr:DNA mismatch repair protein MutS [Fimbriimonadaceae bacterium]
MAEALYSPMYRQWRELKQQHPDTLVLFRLGDFYEMFEDDATAAAAALELTLTGREVGQNRRVPMCGIPYHALDRYLPRLLRQGFRAAICEQVEPPRAGKLVKREVVRVVTAGTLIDEAQLDAAANNYLVAVADAPQAIALAVVDVSTGLFQVTEFTGSGTLEALAAELERLQPAELLCPPTVQSQPLRERVAELVATVTPAAPGSDERLSAAERLRRHFSVARLEAFGVADRPLAQEAAATALRYVQDTQRDQVRQLASLAWYETGDTMTLDAATRRNLELVLTLRDGQPGSGTLLALLDQTCTAPGARLLRSWLLRPLTTVEPIRARLTAVSALHREVLPRQELRSELARVADLERLTTRAATGRATPRDLLALRESLRRLPLLRTALAPVGSTRLQALAAATGEFTELLAQLDAGLADDPPAQLKDGGVIRAGYHADLDELRTLAADGKSWIARLEAAERAATGINSLKIGYNQVFGYYLEVTRANLALVPERYIRKQTIANGERFISPELKEQEARILGAEERLGQLEAQLFGDLRALVAVSAEPLLSTARALAEIDVYAALAHVAAEHGYVCPSVDERRRIDLRDGRHPTVELSSATPFVPNDTLLDGPSAQVQILTGPNMAGKSTYLRQVALIVLMAQIGSFVPASQAEVGVVDRIFTRVGAQDDLATGQSTFMVEMVETALILRHCTPRSLVVLDEIGRGTSTYDGLAIAWAVVEYLHHAERSAALTLFATHYHDLNALEARLERVRNYRVAVAEEQDRVRFLHRIEPGGTDRSYGVEVARLAGLPPWVVRRAQAVLSELEAPGGRPEIGPPPAAGPVQLALFADRGPHPALTTLLQLDVMRMTPLEAINKLSELQRLAQRDD